MAEGYDDLLDRARKSPKSIKFTELIALAGYINFSLDRQKGSHHILVREGHLPLSFQPRHRDPKMAKPYQVRQLLALIDSLKEK